MTENILSKHEILENKIPVITVSGIYFLINEDEIVYVGQASDILNRVYFHAKDKSKVFDSFSFVDIDNDADFNAIEAEYIFRFGPMYNKSMPKNDKYKSFDSLLEVIGTNRWNLNRFIEINQIRSTGGYYRLKDFALFEDEDEEH